MSSTLVSQICTFGSEWPVGGARGGQKARCRIKLPLQCSCVTGGVGPCRLVLGDFLIIGHSAWALIVPSLCWEGRLGASGSVVSTFHKKTKQHWRVNVTVRPKPVVWPNDRFIHSLDKLAGLGTCLH